MEGLLCAFDESVQVSAEEFDTAREHPRYLQYKPTPPKRSQEQRRREILEKQKSSRQEALNERRGIISDHFEEASEQNYRRRNRDLPYHNFLMLSEWLVEIPSDFISSWVATICPLGRRVLLVAENGKSQLFRRNGRCISTFPSLLPGGCSKQSRQGSVIMDCILSLDEKTLYALDLISWNIPLLDCEAEMRFYWLESKLSEISGIDVHSNYNRYRIQCLNHRPVIELPKMMETFHSNVDGIIFFHKEAFYVHGRTPLVTWLKPFMVQDILHIDVHADYRKGVTKEPRVTLNSVLKKFKSNDGEEMEV